MIIDLVDKLIDRCIQLIKHQKEVRRNLLKDHIDPIFNQIEIVHEGYLASFQKYRSCIKSPNHPLNLSHPVFDLILKDSLFSRSEREKLLALSRCLSDPTVGKFLSAIYSYLVYATTDIEDVITIAPKTNIPRRMIAGGLEEVFRFRGNLNAAIKVIDRITEKVQDNYALVLREYYSLKKDLLS
jgi:hypothetical protein